MKNKVMLNLLLVLCALAVLDGLFLTYEHYSTGISLCNFGQQMNCNVVNKSPYSTVDNIFYFMAVDLKWPIPIISIPIGISIFAIIVFAIIGIKTHFIANNKSIGKLHPHLMLDIIRVLLSMSFVYGMWLLYIQHALLQTYCLFCLILDVIIFASLVVSFFVKVEK